jgi:hypothetical protein
MPIKYPVKLELEINDGAQPISNSFILASFYCTDFRSLTKKINECMFIYKLVGTDYKFFITTTSKVNKLIEYNYFDE